MRIAVVGAGGHSKVIRDLILSNPDNRIIGFFDDRYSNLTVKEKSYFGPIASVNELMSDVSDLKLIVAIGDNQTRKSIVHRLKLPKERYATFIHPSAVVSSSVTIGHGTVVMPNTVINADTRIGSHAIINTGSIIEHDNQVSDFVHISPNATLTGSDKIGEGTQIGAGATVIPNIKIGEWSMVGAGSTVIHDVPSGCTAVGVPASLITKKVTGGV